MLGPLVSPRVVTETAQRYAEADQRHGVVTQLLTDIGHGRRILPRRPAPTERPDLSSQAICALKAGYPPRVPHLFEPAASGRSKCRGCGQPIKRGELRFGECLPNLFGEGETTLWFHPLCAAYKRPQPVLEALAGKPRACRSREPRACGTQERGTSACPAYRWCRAVP